MAAAGKGRLDEAAALLSAGADAMLTSKDGSTARDWAVKFGHPEVADFLEGHMQVLIPAGHPSVSSLQSVGGPLLLSHNHPCRGICQ